MKIGGKVLFLILALHAALLPAAAQNYALGTFHSFKGAGLAAEIPSLKAKDFNTLVVYADMAGMYFGDDASPGVKINFSHNARIVDFEPKTLDGLSLFAGAGFSTGWVSDSGREDFGLCGALSGTFGARAIFECGLVLTLGLTFETGGLLYNDGGVFKSSLYRSGLFQTPLPHLTLSYRFK